MKNIVFCAAIILMSGVRGLLAQEDWVLDSTVLEVREVVDDLEIPWELLFVNENHLWVTERRGLVWDVRISDGGKSLLLDLSDQIPPFGSEPGLLGMCLHPDFSVMNTPMVYLVYNFVDENLDILERLSSFEYLNGVLVNEEVLMDSIPGNTVHNGSRIIIDQDRKILMTTGDARVTQWSQDSFSLNGKLLRINLDGSIPEDNPFPDSYVFSLGHRNAQGLYLAPNGILYSTEHGPRESDEINILESTRNYGWPNVEGACDEPEEIDFCQENAVVEPIWEWTPTVAVNDLVYYDHPNVPEFNNCLLVAVLGGFRGIPGVYQMKLSEDGSMILSEEVHLSNLGRIRDICVNPSDGTIYIIDNGFQYPGTSPNSILEYRPNVVAQDERHDQFSVFYDSSLDRIMWGDNMDAIMNRYEIYDVSGRKIINGRNKDHDKKYLNLSSLPSQVYIFAAYKDERLIHSEKFSKR